MRFDPGLGVVPVREPLGFRYEPGVFGPPPERRSLDAIRPSLRDPSCAGPDPVYAIAMDVGREEIRTELEQRMLLFGVVTYAAGRLGDEPVRSQGHVHRVSLHSGWSPPEVYEIWDGAAYVYMQEHAADDPGRCYAILAQPGDTVVVPPGWAHAAISADPSNFLTLGALCDREYGFDYESIKKRQGLGWYPFVTSQGSIEWLPNPRYKKTTLDVRPPGDYVQLGIAPGPSLYEQAVRDFDRFAWKSGSYPRSLEAFRTVINRLKPFGDQNKAATGYVRMVTRSVATSAAAQTKLKLNHAFRRSARPSLPNLRFRRCEALDRT